MMNTGNGPSLDIRTKLKAKQGIMLVVFLAILLQAQAGADIYRYIDEEGNTFFADYPKGSGYELHIKTRKSEESLKTPHDARLEWIGKYVDTIAQLKGIEPELVMAVIKAESNFDHGAVSVKGAKGMMQILPRSFPDKDEEDLFDPLENVAIGVSHLKKLLDKYNGNVTLALAAYNAGEGAVNKYEGVPPYPETEAYIDRVLSYYKRYKE